MKASSTIISEGVEQTERLGRLTAQSIKPGALVFLHGELAAGKTAFVRGFVGHFSAALATEVHSPTFAFMNSYQTTPIIHHLDLYRIESWDAFRDLGLAEAIGDGQTACIEWAKDWLQAHYKPDLTVYFKHIDGDRRELSFHFAEKNTGLQFDK
jgi:tRNA threonylcarbamoyladenosine biosynthesis protein TsaE